MAIKLTKDTKVWDAVKKNLMKTIPKIQTGWFAENVYGSDNDNLQMAQVAQWNNEGHVNGANSVVPGSITPPRPFMTVGLVSAMKAGANKDDFQDMISAVTQGRDVMRVMETSGKNFERTLRKVMVDWDTPPNSPLTIELKGFDNPLIDSSELIANINSRVEK